MLPSLRMTSLHLNYLFQKTCQNTYHPTLTCKWKTSRSDFQRRLNMCVAWFMSWIASRRGRKQQPRIICATVLHSSMSYHPNATGSWIVIMSELQQWLSFVPLVTQSQILLVLDRNSALADCERQCHLTECFNCGQLSQGYNKIGSHMNKTSNILEDQAKVLQRGVIEDLKRHRDLQVSLIELLQRCERAREAAMVESLQKRIANNETKLKSLQASAAAAIANNGAEEAGDSRALDLSMEKVKTNIATVRGLERLMLWQQQAILPLFTHIPCLTFFVHMFFALF